jgi:integrase
VAKIKIEYVELRGPLKDQPRYKPSPAHVRLGMKAQPLRHEDGRWFSAHEALAHINDVVLPEVERRRALKDAGKRIRPVRRAELMSVGRMLEAYADLKQGDGAARSTVTFYRAMARSLADFDPEIFNAPAGALNQKIVFDLYERMRKARRLSMANALMRLMSAAYGYFLMTGKITLPGGNPCTRMRRKALAPRVRAGSPQEMAHLVQAAHALGRPMVAIMIELGLWTGQRQNDRLDMIDGGTTETRVILRQSKTRRFVSIPKSPQLLAALAMSREIKQRLGQDSGRTVIASTVIVNDATGLRYNEHTYRHHFSDVRDAASHGIHDADDGWLIRPMPSLVDFHDQDLRDTAVTWLVRSGSDIFEVASITGHDLQTVHQILKHYLADHPERADSAIAKMVAWFDQQPLEATP